MELQQKIGIVAAFIRFIKTDKIQISHNSETDKHLRPVRLQLKYSKERESIKVVKSGIFHDH